MTIYGISSKEPIVNNRKLNRKVNQPKAFEVNLEEDKQEMLSNNVNLLSNINPFLVLNEINSEEEEKKLLKERGKKLIDILKEIRLMLLDGNIPTEKLLDLKNYFEKLEFTSQTNNINIIIEDIKLRVEVELAKIEKSENHFNFD